MALTVPWNGQWMPGTYYSMEWSVCSALTIPWNGQWLSGTDIPSNGQRMPGIDYSLIS